MTPMRNAELMGRCATAVDLKDPPKALINSALRAPRSALVSLRIPHSALGCLRIPNSALAYFISLAFLFSGPNLPNDAGG